MTLMGDSPAYVLLSGICALSHMNSRRSGQLSHKGGIGAPPTILQAKLSQQSAPAATPSAAHRRVHQKEFHGRR
jgi:hypothetical protein